MMNYNLLNADGLLLKESAGFAEGALLALNMACEPLPYSQWSEYLAEGASPETEQGLLRQLQSQYDVLMANQYSVGQLIDLTDDEALADFAEGFMSLWPHVEAGWGKVALADGTERMLQALLTTWMLAIDQDETQQQMRAAGIDNPPQLQALLPNLDLMITEVAAAADTVMLGNRSQMRNPYKEQGRNEACPCGSGKKFKHCCGA